MKIPSFLFVLVAVLIPVRAQVATPTADLLSVGSLLVLGRLPNDAERNSGPKATDGLAPAIRWFEERVRDDAAERRMVIARSFVDAYGRRATDAELAEALGGAVSYVQLMKRHVSLLGTQRGEYEAVIRRVYPLVIHREVYPEEIAYWEEHGPLPFVLLAGCVEDWARRNQPGLMVTAGVPTISVHSEFLVTARMLPEQAKQARIALDLSAPATDQSTHHVVAAGGERIATEGGMYFAVAGQPGLVK